MMCFSDGRPAPLLKGQIRRQKQREEFAVRLLCFWIVVFVPAYVSFKEKLEMFQMFTFVCTFREEQCISVQRWMKG